MKKLAYENDTVYVSLTCAEFEGLARDTVENAPSNQHISLGWIASILDQVDNFQSFIVEAKTHAVALAAKLELMIT